MSQGSIKTSVEAANAHVARPPNRIDASNTPDLQFDQYSNSNNPLLLQTYEYRLTWRRYQSIKGRKPTFQIDKMAMIVFRDLISSVFNKIEWDF